MRLPLPLPRPLDGLCPAGSALAGATSASVPWALGVGSEGRKEPEAIPGPTDSSHPWKGEEGRVKQIPPPSLLRRSGTAAGWPAGKAPWGPGRRG